MKEIKLTQGKVASVDDEDFDWLNQWKWCASKKEGHWRAMRRDYSCQPSRTIYMHRLILDPPSHMGIDHHNGDSLDNRRSNLRACTHSQNAMNSRKRRNCTSRYKGVYWHCRSRKWIASIKIHDRQQHLGCFDNELNAAAAYNQKACEYFGRFARLNDTDTEIAS